MVPLGSRGVFLKVNTDTPLCVSSPQFSSPLLCSPLLYSPRFFLPLLCSPLLCSLLLCSVLLSIPLFLSPLFFPALFSSPLLCSPLSSFSPLSPQCVLSGHHEPIPALMCPATPDPKQESQTTTS